MSTLELRVTGMTCDHCAHTVETALSAVAGVERASVAYGDGKASVEVQDSVDSAALVCHRGQGLRREVAGTRWQCEY